MNGDAEVFVEAGDEAKEAIVTDLDGIVLGQTSLKIVLSNRDRLVVTRRRAHLLQLDFDLAASHEVDIVATPAIAASEQFIVAEVHPVDEKDIRVRGPLVAVSEDDTTIEEVYDPYLIMQGYLNRTPRGRVAMPAAYARLGIEPPQDLQKNLPI